MQSAHLRLVPRHIGLHEQPGSHRLYAVRMARSHALVRPRRRLIGGVCAALVDRSVMRILFIASCLLPGPQILLYLALWIILPSE
jgi:phage shock protein PspC (stress-responsive transcriptional regulator)